MLSLKLKNEIKQEQRKQLIFIDSEKDDQYEILFKYYETLRNFMANVEHMDKISKDYQNDFKYAGDAILKPH